MKLWVLAAALVLAGLLILLVWIPSRRPPALREGVRVEAQVLSKDSRPLADGGTYYSVRFIYQDEQRRNHDVACEVGAGTWNRLKAGQKVGASYLPADPNQAYMDGAVMPAGRRSGALSFLAYSALVAGILVGLYAARDAIDAKDLRRT